jgi:molecular chaperone DnaK
MVSHMLRSMTGIESEHAVNPDEAVARGAALYAGYLLGKQGAAAQPPTFEVSNVNSHSLGVEGIDPETLRKTNAILIPRNTRLPAKFTERFVTKSENQRSIVVQVLEGESSSPEACTVIGRSVIQDLPTGLPKGWPIDVTFRYAANGCLSVRAVVPGTHQTAKLKLERAAGLSNAGIARWKQPVSTAAGFEAFEMAISNMLNELDETPPEDADVSPWSGATEGKDEAGKPPHATDVAPACGTRPGPATRDAAAAARDIIRALGEDAGRTIATTPKTPVKTDRASPKSPSKNAVSPPKPREDPRQRPVPRWLISLIAYAVSAVLGLSLGYVLLSWLCPDAFPWPW